MRTRGPFTWPEGTWLLLCVAVSLLAHAVFLVRAGWSLPPGSVAPEPELTTVIHLTAPPAPPAPEPVVEPDPLPPEPAPDPIPEPEPLPEPPAPPPPKPAQDPVPAAKPKPRAKPSTSLAPTRPALKTAPQPVVAPKPLARRNGPPVYPELARRQGWQGSVLVRATVTAAGKVSGVSLARSSGHTVLDEAALRAVRRWVFAPGSQSGRLIGGVVEVPVNFRLR